jgi:hypothetical protein
MINISATATSFIACESYLTIGDFQTPVDDLM